MARIDPKFKEALKSSGMWTEFVDTREALKSAGVSGKEANEQVVSAFTDRVNSFLETGRSDMNANNAMSTASPSVVDTAGSGSPESDRCADQEASILDGLSKEEYAEFVKREGDIVTSIRWVAKHLDAPLKYLDIETIPCAEALGMLLSYRTPLRRSDFWDKMYSRLVPSKTQLDSRGTLDIELDGASMIKACERILAIKQKSELKE